MVSVTCSAAGLRTCSAAVTQIMINSLQTQFERWSVATRWSYLRVVHTRVLRIWIENFFFPFSFFLSKIFRSERDSNQRSWDFEPFCIRLLTPLSYRANQNISKTNRFYTKQKCSNSFISFNIIHSKKSIAFNFREKYYNLFLRKIHGRSKKKSMVGLYRSMDGLL